MDSFSDQCIFQAKDNDDHISRKVNICIQNEVVRSEDKEHMVRYIRILAIKDLSLLIRRNYLENLSDYLSDNLRTNICFWQKYTLLNQNSTPIE